MSEKFHLHVAADGVLKISSPKGLPASIVQVRVSYYEKGKDGSIEGLKKTRTPLRATSSPR